MLSLVAFAVSVVALVISAYRCFSLGKRYQEVIDIANRSIDKYVRYHQMYLETKAELELYKSRHKESEG